MAGTRAANGRPLAPTAWIEIPDHPTAAAHAKARTEAHAWYAIHNAASPDEAELLLYDEIGGFFGTWADEFLEDLNNVTAPKLRVRVNSPGGSVFEGIALANALRAHPADVTIQVDGIAASIASVIAMAGDRVVMGPQSTLMIHDASGVCLGDAAEMAKMAEVLDLLSNNIADAYAEKAGGTREEWRTRMRAETWYLADEAVTAGLADEVMPSRRRDADTEDPMNRAWDLSVFRYAGREQAPDPAAAAAPESTEPAAEEPRTATVPFDLTAPGVEEQLVAMIRQQLDAHGGEVTPGVGPEPVAVPTEPAAPAPEPAEPAGAPAAPETAAQPDDKAPDGWADQTAHLYADDAPDDDWAQLVAQLTEPSPALSSSAATA